MPVLIAAVIVTGDQYLLAMQASAGQVIEDWRSGLIHSLGVQSIAPDIYDILVAGLAHVIPVFIVALIAGGFWERLFAEKRNRPFDIGVIYTALLVTLLMPPAVGLFHLAFGISFAMVFAHGIFGGEGRSFLNPALVAVAFVQITFPAALTNHNLWADLNGYAGTRLFLRFHQQAFPTDFNWWDTFIGNTQGLMGSTSLLAVLTGACVLLYGGIISWRLLAGLLFGVIFIATFCNWLGGGILDMPWYWHVLLGSFGFAAVFIAADPSSSASTDAGRWIQGILAGALVVILRVLNPSHSESVIQVFLLVSMLAPLIDHVVIWFNIRQRAQGRG